MTVGDIVRLCVTILLTGLVLYGGIVIGVILYVK